MKNWTIRKKMIPLYLIISIFTFLWFFASWAAIADAAAAPENAEAIIRNYLIIFPIYLVVYFVCIFAVGRTVAKQVAFPARALAEAAQKVAHGDIDITLEHQSKDEMGVLTDSFRAMIEGIRLQAEVLSTMAGGDYTPSLKLRGENDVMNKAIRAMLNNNNEMLGAIRDAAQSVNGGAAQIASSAQALASGSTQQAASVEEFSATLGMVKQHSDENAEASQQALEASKLAGEKMQDGIASMAGVTAAMEAIDHSSAEITKVIKVIDDIAFQTNILALNAAVEAARAGQHGKGFAVVADEVRNLASKSADAAKETTGLIEDSRAKVREGSGVVERTGATLNEVAELAGQTQELVFKISQSSAEQAQNIDELNTGIAQISAVVQSNSATAEESAASAQEMSAQSQMLERTVSRFKLYTGSGSKALPGPRS